MGDLIIKPESGGSIKLQNNAGTNALVSDNSGNVTLAGTTTISSAGITSGTIASAVTFPAGHIINVWFDKDSVPASYNSTAHTWQDSNLSITLTPASVNSKFIIQGQFDAIDNSNCMSLRIVNNGNTTNTMIGDKTGNRDQSTRIWSYEGFDGNQRNNGGDYCVYDVPATTSQIIYKLQYTHENADYQINRNQNWYNNAGQNYSGTTISTMIIYEIVS